MASLAPTAAWQRPLRAGIALLKADLLSLSKSWVLRGWLVVLALSEFATLTGTLAAGKLANVPASTVLTPQLNFYLVLWSMPIIVISAGSVTLEADMVADSILCRACTRTQYILAKLASRMLVIGAIYLAGAGIAGYCAWRYAAPDVTWLTVATGIGIVGMAVLLLVALGVTMSVLSNNMYFSVIGLLLLWYIAAPVFSFLGAEYLSPASLNQNLPRILRDADAPQVVQCSAGTSSLTVTFSKEVKQEQAEEVGNYSVTCPSGKKRAVKTAAYDPSRTCVVLGGLKLPEGKTAKVIVAGVIDGAGNEISPAADFATAKVAKAAGDEETSPADTATRSGKDRRLAEDGGSRAEPGSGAKSDPANATESSPPEAAANTTDDTTGTDEKAQDKPTPATDTPDAPERPKAPPVKGPFRVLKLAATASSAKVTFSRDVQPEGAEKVKNYVVESPVGKTQTARAAVYDAETRTVLLSGLQFREGDAVKVTAKNVKDARGNLLSRRGNSATYTDVATWKYFLGFGGPTLLFGLLAVVGFGRRDL